ncbi:hypothetical protein M7I_4303 [Glarea lozoyensis 74030]|uniref:Uncharacterized protein n=1 Tax=Glarea lozoyensis (strain ATCC 74030 / MF5533) TaxID=1104152 RepID=H0ENU0_GLAL7|nr:hypothetical protein M7I_4303 [Glarea lozoyensis 74030]
MSNLVYIPPYPRIFVTDTLGEHLCDKVWKFTNVVEAGRRGWNSIKIASKANVVISDQLPYMHDVSNDMGKC